MTAPSLPAQEAPLSGAMLWFAALILASANFIAVLDMTITNVSVPNIAGSLGASTSQGTWVITSYAVAEAISVPLTGWLAARFGAVRVFVSAMVLFGVFSAMCGLAHSLGMLVAGRILQGLAGGPLMPLSQTLLLRIFPPKQAPAAIGLWSMTTLVAPVLGPILGGYLCDNLSWPWIFYINLPIAVGCAFMGWRLLRRYEAPLVQAPIDRVGLVLLLVWVSALQLMLDEGKNLDWFASTEIRVLAGVAVVGLAAFLIWELNDPHPIVDLRVFRHRGYWVSVLTISSAFAAFFAVNVLTPLWLQSFMGYTSSNAGQATAWTGVFAVLVAPLAAGLSAKVDPRRLVFMGVGLMGLVTLWRTGNTTDIDHWQISVPLMVMGLGLPFFFIPLTGLAMGSVDPAETANAAGLMNFLRTLSGAFGTSLVTTAWDDEITQQHAELVGAVDRDQAAQRVFEQLGQSPEAVLQNVDGLVSGQAVMLATNHMFGLMGLALLIASCMIWLAPKPTRAIDPAAATH